MLYEILYPQWQNTSKSVSRWTEFGRLMCCLRYIFWPFNQLGFRILLPHLWLRNQCCGMFCLPGLTELRHPLMESWVIFLRVILVPIWPMVWIGKRMACIGSPVDGQQKNFSGSPSNSRDNIMCLLAPDTLVQWKYSYLLDHIAQISDTIVEDEPCVWILDLFMIRIPHHNSSELIKATQSQPCREKGKIESWRSAGQGLIGQQVLVYLPGQPHGQRAMAAKPPSPNENAIILVTQSIFLLSWYLFNSFLNAPASLVCSKCDLNYISLIYKQPFRST